MRLLFCPGDSLAVTPSTLEQVNVGDVVIFRNINAPEGEGWTVHRVVAHRGDGLITQGDNNPRRDFNLLTAANLVGVVRSYERSAQIKRVWGGRGGLVYSKVMRRLRRLARWVLGLGRYPYRWLRQSGLVQRIWRPNLVRMQIETEHGTLVKYIHRRRTVATWHPQRRTFSVNKPYDLVIRPPENDPLK